MINKLYHFCAINQSVAGVVQYRDGTMATNANMHTDFTAVCAEIGRSFDPPCERPTILSFTLIGEVDL